MKMYISSARGRFLSRHGHCSSCRHRRVRQHVHVGLAGGKDIKTDCSVNAQIQGKTYCFGSQSALTQFMADPSGNLAKARLST